MKIKFNETLYDLVTQPYIYSTRFQCNILKGENTYDSIIEDTFSPETITVYNDEDEVQGIYSEYTHRVALTVMDDISIELENPDLAQQIQELTDVLASQQEQINSKLDSSAMGESETIGEPSKNSYKVDDTFPADGKLYKATATITVGNILVDGGNCEPTNINDTIKEDEV